MIQLSTTLLAARKKAKKDVELFRNGSVHEFYRLKALITLKQVITKMVGKKNNLNKQNFDGEGNWLGVVSFHCLQRSLVMSMRFIFGDDWNDAPYSPPFLDFRLFTHAFKSCNSETNRRNRNVVLNFFRLFLFLSV